MYIAFLDEFGHIGPFVSRTDPRFSQSPVFGLAGFIIPHHHARHIATWFFQAKNNLLTRELRSIKVHPATWEKKGTSLITTKNILKYYPLRKMIFRLISEIYRCGGRIIYYGRHKYQSPDQSKAKGLYTTVLAHIIRNSDDFCQDKDDKHFMMILDQHESRIDLIATAAKTMFGGNPARNLIEPLFQVESHLYQTIQAADWIATVIGRIMAYRMMPTEFVDWEWAERFFGQRIGSCATHSTLWRPRVN